MYAILHFVAMKKILITFLAILYMHTLHAQPCASLTTFPHYENFISSNTSLGCWSIINSGDANTWTFSGDQASIAYSANAHDDYLITPGWIVQIGRSEMISIDARNRSMSYPEQFDVLLSTTGINAADFTNVIASGVTPQTAASTFNYNLSAYAGQTVYVAFRNTTTNQWLLYLDNFTIYEAPSCPAPTAFVSSNISATGADLSWTAGATESAWNGASVTVSVNGSAVATWGLSSSSAGTDSLETKH